MLDLAFSPYSSLQCKHLGFDMHFHPNFAFLKFNSRFEWDLFVYYENFLPESSQFLRPCLTLKFVHFLKFLKHESLNQSWRFIFNYDVKFVRYDVIYLHTTWNKMGGCLTQQVCINYKTHCKYLLPLRKNKNHFEHENAWRSWYGHP